MVLSRKPICPPKYELHDAYKTKTGKIVHARCVRKTGIISPGSSENKMANMISMSRKRSKKALSLSKKMGLPIRERCKEGETLRSGYRRTSYNRKTGKGNHYSHSIVAPGCIKKRGSTKIPTRTEKQKSKRSTLIILDNDDHFLSEYGYFEVETKTKENRIESLKKLIAHFIPIKGEMATYNYIIKALNARYILNRNSNPKVAKIFKNDQKTISKIYKNLKQKNR
jgi:hypothetical protein